MAYVRWERGSDWYIFWESSAVTSKGDERLAIWHADARDRTFGLSYREIVEKLQNSDFADIPGYEPRYHALLHQVLSSFVSDVDLEYSRRAAD